MRDPARIARECLRRPYSRVLVEDTESHTFMARVLEFPGCVTQGDSATEALTRLDEVALSWITAALETGREIPPPIEEQQFNGRILLRVPRTLHRAAVERADQEGVSLNQFLVWTISEKMGVRSAGPAPGSEARELREACGSG